MSTDHQQAASFELDDQSTFQASMTGVDHNEERDGYTPRTDLALDPDSTYASSGVKPTLHGTIYQSKLLGLFVKRALKEKYDFLLATEMDAAEKFDDVVFIYRDHEDKWNRFLQAKHKLDPENTKITINDLKSTSNDNPFSLQKYFISFCKIRDNELFKGLHLKDFVIITNTGFDFSKNLDRKQDGKRAQEHNEVVDKWSGFFEKENLKDDEILYFETKDFKAEKFKFKNNAKADLTEIFKSILWESALKAKVIEDLSSAKEKLEASKVLNLKDLVAEAEEAVENLKGEYESKKNRKGEILKEAKKVLRLQVKILENNTGLKHFIEELEKTSAVNKKDKTQKDTLDKAIKHVLDEANEVLIAAEKKLEISEEYKTSNTNKFRELKKDKEQLSTFEDNLKEIKDKISKAGTTLDDIKNEIKNEAVTKTIPTASLNYIKKKTTSDLQEGKETLVKILGEAISKISVIKVALNDTLDVCLQEFLKKFRFVTSYPNEKELGDFIKNELGETFHLLNADLVSDSFEREMLNFLKSYKNGKAEFYSGRDGEKFFDELNKKINTLMMSGLSKAYPEKLRAYRICFENNLNQLEDFLSYKTQIVHVSTQSTRLSAIKVLQTLENDKFKEKYSYLAKEDGYIFMRLRTLLRKMTNKYATDAFLSAHSHNLFIIECQPKNQETRVEIDQLHTQLLKALNDKKSSKKIILIASSHDDFAAMFKISEEHKIQDIKIYFEDLNSKSQDKVLEREVNFQGKDIRLNELIEKSSAGKIIDHVSLLRLIEGEQIPIGDENAFSSIGYVKDYYIPRTLHRQKIKTEVLKEEIGSELFFITGADVGNLLTSLGVKKKEIHAWKNKTTHKTGIIWPPSSQSDKNNKEIFQKLGEKVHWLEYHECNLFWRTSTGNLLALQKYIEKDIRKEEQFIHPETFGQKVIILANDPGVGKSTVLTNIAREMKQENPAFWMVRVNLNDYAVHEKEPQSLHNIKFQEHEIEKVVDFVSKMVVSGTDDDPKIQFQRRLFEAGLKGDKKPKIVILFDGFDEISPSYKRNTTKLIEALKTSNLIQLWVSTRVHEKADLEEDLKSPSYILNPLTEEKEAEFLNKFWRWSLKFLDEKDSQETYEKIIGHLKDIKSSIEFWFASSNNEKTGLLEKLDSILNQAQPTQQLESLRVTIDELNFSDYASRLLLKFKELILDTKKSFTNVPQNLKMLAVVIFENKFQLPENKGLYEELDLYDTFKKIRFDIYYKEKNKMVEGNEGVNEIIKRDLEDLGRVHYQLAVKIFFSEEYKKDLLPGLDELSRFKNEELARVGLLTLKGDQLEFTHHSFAEYFLSEYLVKNLENEQVQKLLLEKILIKKYYALIRKFFASQLGRNSKEDILKKAIEISVAEANSSILEDTKKIAELLLERFKYQPSDTFHELVLRTDEEKNGILDLFNDNDQTIKALINWIGNNLETDTLEKLMDTNYGSGLLENENYEVIDCLLTNGVEAEYFIPPKIRYYLLLAEIEEVVIHNFSDSDFASDNEDSSGSSGSSESDKDRARNANIVWTSLEPFLENFKNIKKAIINKSSKNKIIEIRSTIKDRIEELENIMKTDNKYYLSSEKESVEDQESNSSSEPY